MQDPTYPLYPVFVFISFVIVLIPMPWHLQAWNVGTISYMLWTAVAALNQFINNVVWRDNDINFSYGWCDISSRIIVAANVALPCASLTITRRLYKITRVCAVTADPKEKRRDLIIDLLVCVFFPMFQMVLYWFIQGHRFNIFEQFGCFPVAINTPPTYFLLWMWPILLGVTSSVYCVFTLRAFLNRRREMSQFLTSSSFMNFSRYFRLMTIATMDTLLTVPFGIYTLWINLSEFGGVVPWKGLADVHFDFGRVEQIPAIEWRSNHLFVVSVNMSRWAVVVAAFMFFALFGFAEDARRFYAKTFWRVAKLFGYMPKPTGSAWSGSSFGAGGMRTPYIPHSNANSSSGSTNRGGLRVLVNTKNEKRSRARKHDSFLSSLSGGADLGLDSSITVDSTFEERKDLDLKNRERSGSGSGSSSRESLPASPDDIELQCAGLPTLTLNSDSDRPQAAPVPVRPHPSEALVLNFPATLISPTRPERAAFGPDMV